MSFVNKIFIFARYIIGQKKENNDIPKSGSTALMETKKIKQMIYREIGVTIVIFMHCL